MPSLRNIALTLLRWLVGGVFIFSGFVKAVDPVGTSVFVEKYLATYSLEVLLPLALLVAVVLAVVEFALGASLVMRARYRLTLLITTLFISIFAVITLLSATLLPIGDCGCFGDAVTLSPWATFAKNVALLVAVALLWRADKVDATATRGEWMVVAIALALGLTINLYALRHQPIIDFMPYKVGVDLRGDVMAEREAVSNAERSVLICRNQTTGELREFDSSSEEWWDGWDVVDTRLESLPDEELHFADFTIFDSMGEECSERLLMREGRVAWLCVRDRESLNARAMSSIDRLRELYPSEAIVVLTADDCVALSDILDMECYSLDAMTLRSMMRSEVGVIILESGMIRDKRNHRDI